MKIAIISDSHGNKKGIDKLFSEGGFDYLFYLGDGISDLGNYIYLDNVFSVSGNCDFFSTVENEKVIDLEGVKFFLTHGNKYGVKYSYDTILERGKELGARFICFGHTHRQCMEIVDDMYLLNPGSFKKIDGVSKGILIDITKGSVSLNTLKII